MIERNMASKLLKITREEYKELLPEMIKVRDHFVKKTGCNYYKIFTHRNCNGGRTKLWLATGNKPHKLPKTVTVGKYTYAVSNYGVDSLSISRRDIAIYFKRIT